MDAIFQQYAVEIQEETAFYRGMAQQRSQVQLVDFLHLIHGEHLDWEPGYQQIEATRLSQRFAKKPKRDGASPGEV